MMINFQRRYMSAYIKERLTHLHKNTNKTVGIVVDKSEIENLDFLGHLTKSKEFKMDLAM